MEESGLVAVVDIPEEQNPVEEHPGSTPSELEKHCRGIIWAKVAAHRLKGSREGSVPAIGQQECTSQFLGNEDISIEEQLEHLIAVHNGIFQQLNSYGVVLTLLAALTSVAILQPPGPFNDQGHMQQQSLVACFLLFSSASFLLACTGLLVLIVGSASLFKPWFFHIPDSPSERMGPVKYTDTCIGRMQHCVFDNVSRLKRLRVYLCLSLLSYMWAFVCGAFAILGPEKRNWYIAIAIIVISSSVLVVEIGIMTPGGVASSPNWQDWLLRIRNFFLNFFRDKRKKEALLSSDKTQRSV